MAPSGKGKGRTALTRGELLDLLRDPKKRYLWIALAILLSYCMYLPTHYGMDSFACEDLYRTIDSLEGESRTAAALAEATSSCFSSGRYTRGVLFLLFALAGKAQWLLLPWVNVVGIVFLCLAACAAWAMLREHGAVKNALVFPCLLIAFCQPFFTDWLQFTECQIYHPLGLFLAVLAAKTAFRPGERTWIGKAWQWGKGLILLLLAAGLYQVTMQWFVLFTTIVVVLESVEHPEHTPAELAKKAALKACWGASLYGVAALVQLLFTRVLYQSARIDERPLLERLGVVMDAQQSLWLIEPYTGSWWSLLFPALVGLQVLLIAVAISRSRTAPTVKWLRAAVAAVCAAGFYWSIFLPLLFSELWFPQRSLVGFWALPLLLAVAVGEPERKRKGRTYEIEGTAVVAAALLLVNVVCCFQFGTGIYRVNELDLARAQRIEDAIAAYESETGQTVRYVAFHHDVYPTYGYTGIVWSHENNGAAWSRPWNFLSLMRKVGGRDYQQREYSDERFLATYGAVNWNTFSSEQVVLEGDTAYIAVY